MAVAVPGRAQEFERAVGSVADMLILVHRQVFGAIVSCLRPKKIASLARSEPSVLEIQVEKLLGRSGPRGNRHWESWLLTIRGCILWILPLK